MNRAPEQAELVEWVRAARERTGVPGAAAGVLAGGAVRVAADGVRELGREEPVLPETPFRIASISKPFTAALAASCLELDAEVRALLGHTAGLCPESETPLPAAARGLWSYSNAGYWRVGAACARACGGTFADAMRSRVLEPAALGATGYDEPPAPARGHVQEGETGHRAVPRDEYPEARYPSGGLWSTVGDLLGFAAHLLGGDGPLDALREPQAEALGAAYGLGLWIRRAGGVEVLDHEGSVAGYQSLLLLVPEERFALAVLTNSWRGSALIRRLVLRLGLAPDTSEASYNLLQGLEPPGVAGRYALENGEAVVERAGDGLRVQETEIDPVTRARIAKPAVVAEPLGDGVLGVAGGVLIGHRLDFPRPGIGRIGWVAMPRVGP